MSLKIVVLAKQVPDTRNVGKDAMNADGTINRAALPAIFNPEDLNALEQAQLKEWAEHLPQGLDTPLGEFGSRLSGGQKQRIGIARALYKQAEILFFDEATSALDHRTEQEINHALQELSHQRHELTIVIIAHRESSLAFCDRIFDLDSGNTYTKEK